MTKAYIYETPDSFSKWLNLVVQRGSHRVFGSTCLLPVMDPLATIMSCYKLYESVNNKIKSLSNNRNQFDLLAQRVAETAEPIKRLKDLCKYDELPCSAIALEGLHRTLEKVQAFVEQERFIRAPSSTADGVLNLVAERYYGAADKEQFKQFNIMISNSLQSLNLPITMKILDFTLAATKDAARAAEITAKVQLTQIDSKRFDWDINNISTKLGSGSFSTMYMGRYYGEYVAIKEVQQGTMTSRDRVKLIAKEAMIMQFADHPNILKLKSVSLTKGLLVMELALCSLADYLHRQNDLARGRSKAMRTVVPTPSLQWKLGIVRDVVDAVSYLHSFSILHRDIKSANVLLFYDPATGTTTAKVGDFGLTLAMELVSRTTATGTFATATASTASSQGSLQPRAAGTPNYMAPELFDRRPRESIAYSEASDVYSLGVLANEVLTERVPWDADAREVDMEDWVFREHLRPQLYAGEGCNNEAAVLMRVIGGSDVPNSCWNQLPSQRCTAEEVYLSIDAMPAPVPLPAPAPAAKQADGTAAATTLSGRAYSVTPPLIPMSVVSSTKPSAKEIPPTFSPVPNADDPGTAASGVAGGCCIEWGDTHYPGRFWLPDSHPRADPWFRRDRDFYSAYRPYCRFCISPLVLDCLCCCRSSYVDRESVVVSAIVRLIICPCLYLTVPLYLLNDHVLLNLCGRGCCS